MGSIQKLCTNLNSTCPDIFQIIRPRITLSKLFTFKFCLGHLRQEFKEQTCTVISNLNYIEWNINSIELKTFLQDELSSNPTGLDQDQKDQNRNNELEMSEMEDFEKFPTPTCNCQVRKFNSHFQLQIKQLYKPQCRFVCQSECH